MQHEQSHVVAALEEVGANCPGAGGGDGMLNWPTGENEKGEGDGGGGGGGGEGGEGGGMGGEGGHAGGGFAGG